MDWNTPRHWKGWHWKLKGNSGTLVEGPGSGNWLELASSGSWNFNKELEQQAGENSSVVLKHFNATQAWRYYDSLLAKDKANGTYEAGRFAQQVAKISPQDSQAMMLAYNQMRKKSGTVPKQTAANKNTGKTYTNY